MSTSEEVFVDFSENQVEDFRTWHQAVRRCSNEEVFGRDEGSPQDGFVKTEAVLYFGFREGWEFGAGNLELKLVKK